MRSPIGGQFEKSPGHQIERDDKLIVISIAVEGSCDGWAAEVTDVLRGVYKDSEQRPETWVRS